MEGVVLAGCGAAVACLAAAGAAVEQALLPLVSKAPKADGAATPVAAAVASAAAAAAAGSVLLACGRAAVAAPVAAGRLLQACSLLPGLSGHGQLFRHRHQPAPASAWRAWIQRMMPRGTRSSLGLCLSRTF